MAQENALLETFARECTVRMEGANLAVDRSAIGPNAALSVRASIMQDGTLQWTSDIHHPVPMDRDGESITVLMVRVGNTVEE